jgi:hypothetical protein
MERTLVLAGAVDDPDDLEGVDGVGGPGQREPAVDAADGAEIAGVDQRLEDLGQVLFGQPALSVDLGEGHEAAGRLPGDVTDPVNGIN